MKPLISIVIAVYNAENYIKKCFESIDRQYKNYEVVIIDDGSTDNSGKICDLWAINRDNIRVYHQYNQGIAVTRNNGIKYSIGEYIVFIDPDDWVNDDFTLKIQKMIENNKDSIVDALLYNYSFVCSKNSQLETAPSPYCYPKSVATGKEVVKWLMNGKFVDFMWIATIKRSLYVDNNIKFPNIKVHEDAATLYRVLFFAKNVVCTNQPLYSYFQRTDSLSHALTLDRTTNFLQQFKIMDNFFLTNDNSEFIQYSKEYKLIRLLAAYQNLVRVNEKSSIKRHYFKELKKEIHKNFVIFPCRKITRIKQMLFYLHLLKVTVYLYDWKKRRRQCL